MKKQFKNFIAFIICIVAVSVFTIAAAQMDSTSTAPWSPVDLIPASWKGWIAFLAVIWEGIVLLRPTLKNLSIVGNIIAWISKGGNKKQ